MWMSWTCGKKPKWIHAHSGPTWKPCTEIHQHLWFSNYISETAQSHLSKCAGGSHCSWVGACIDPCFYENHSFIHTALGLWNKAHTQRECSNPAWKGLDTWAEDFLVVRAQHFTSMWLLLCKHFFNFAGPSETLANLVRCCWHVSACNDQPL